MQIGSLNQSYLFISPLFRLRVDWRLPSCTFSSVVFHSRGSALERIVIIMCARCNHFMSRSKGEFFSALLIPSTWREQGRPDSLTDIWRTVNSICPFCPDLFLSPRSRTENCGFKVFCGVNPLTLNGWLPCATLSEDSVSCSALFEF